MYSLSHRSNFVSFSSSLVYLCLGTYVKLSYTLSAPWRTLKYKGKPFVRLDSKNKSTTFQNFEGSNI